MNELEKREFILNFYNRYIDYNWDCHIMRLIFTRYGKFMYKWLQKHKPYVIIQIYYHFLRSVRSKFTNFEIYFNSEYNEYLSEKELRNIIPKIIMNNPADDNIIDDIIYFEQELIRENNQNIPKLNRTFFGKN